jgi:hypothetical protein
LGKFGFCLAQIIKEVFDFARVGHVWGAVASHKLAELIEAALVRPI